MARIWSEEGKLRAWLDVELAATAGWAELGIVPAEAARSLQDAAQPPTPERVAELEAILHHDTAAFVDAVAEAVWDEGRWFHYGAGGADAATDPELERIACERLGLEPAPTSTQILQRDRHAELLTAFAIAGSSLDKFALEIRHLARTEVAEVQEPFGRGQKGSSAMPHKRNPVVAERICGLARVLRGAAVVGLENVALWHERDISHSSAERVVLPDAFLALDYMLDRFTWLMEGLVVRE